MSQTRRVSIESGHDHRTFSDDYAVPLRICVDDQVVFTNVEGDDKKGGCGWVLCRDRKPANGLPVIAYGVNEYGKSRRLRAMFIERWTMEDEWGDWEDVTEYCEEKDKYFIMEGWYENNEYEDTHWKVGFEVTHWMSLPEPPGQ